MARTPTSEWGRRAHAAGLDQATLARLADMAPNSVSRGLLGATGGSSFGRLRALILAWEIMAPDQRALWLERAAGPEDGAASAA